MNSKSIKNFNLFWKIELINQIVLKIFFFYGLFTQRYGKPFAMFSTSIFLFKSRMRCIMHKCIQENTKQLCPVHKTCSFHFTICYLYFFLLFMYISQLQRKLLFFLLKNIKADVFFMKFLKITFIKDYIKDFISWKEPNQSS